VRKGETYEVMEAEAPTLEEEPRKRRTRESERGALEPTQRKTVRIDPYGVSKDRLLRAINDMQVSATIAKTPKDADTIKRAKKTKR